MKFRFPGFLAALVAAVLVSMFGAQAQAEVTFPALEFDAPLAAAPTSAIETEALFEVALVGDTPILDKHRLQTASKFNVIATTITFMNNYKVDSYWFGPPPFVKVEDEDGNKYVFQLNGNQFDIWRILHPPGSIVDIIDVSNPGEPVPSGDLSDEQATNQGPVFPGTEGMYLPDSW